MCTLSFALFSLSSRLGAKTTGSWGYFVVLLRCTAEQQNSVSRPQKVFSRCVPYHAVLHLVYNWEKYLFVRVCLRTEKLNQISPVLRNPSRGFVFPSYSFCKLLLLLSLQASNCLRISLLLEKSLPPTYQRLMIILSIINTTIVQIAGPCFSSFSKYSPFHWECSETFRLTNVV